MIKTIANPKWELVTDTFQEPTTCKELSKLLTPATPTGNEESIISLSWKKKQFYQKENVLLFLAYAEKKLVEMSAIDKNHFEVVLRMMRLYREIDDYEAAYQLAQNKEIISFIQTSLHFSKWDTLTKTVALSYLVTKYRVLPLEEFDYQIFHRVKLDTEWIKSLDSLLTHEELFSFYLWYVKMFGNQMMKEEMDDYLMGITVYLTNHFVDLFTEKTALEYSQWVHQFSELPINKAIIHIHRALCAHFIELLGIDPTEKLDDYNVEIIELLSNADTAFLERYYETIGKLISYIPFYEKFSTRLQLRYFENLMLSFIGFEDGKAELIQNCIIPQLVSDFGTFMNYLFQHKKIRLIESILCDWLTVDDHQYLNQVYEMDVLYTTFGKG